MKSLSFMSFMGQGPGTTHRFSFFLTNTATELKKESVVGVDSTLPLSRWSSPLSLSLPHFLDSASFSRQHSQFTGLSPLVTPVKSTEPRQRLEAGRL